MSIEAALAKELRGWIGGDPSMRGALLRLGGGESNECYRFELADPPAGVPSQLVLRLLHDDRAAEREWAIQAAVGVAGFPVPTNSRTGLSASAFEQPFSIAEYIEGRDPIGDGSMRRIPQILADTMCDLHGLPWEPVQSALAGRRGDVADAVDELEHSPAPEIVRAAGWFAQNGLGQQRVVCHGDLHARNLVMDRGRVVGVLDWEIAVLAPRAYDVARTELLLLLMPGIGSPAARPFVRLLGKRLARQFVGAYRARAAIEDVILDRCRAFHALRLIALLRTPGGVARRVRQLWQPFDQVLVRRWRRLTGRDL